MSGGALAGAVLVAGCLGLVLIIGLISLAVMAVMDVIDWWSYR